MIHVAVIGAGYWGPNLIRNFASCQETKLVAVCDKDRARLEKVLAGYPGVDAVDNSEALLSRDDVDAVAIATPVGAHAPLTLAALRAGKHVLVEKPLAACVRDAEAMVRAAKEAGRVLMVDHTFIYSGPVQKIKEIVDSGDLGDIYYVDSVRINLGLFQHDVNVVWDLAPHDLSIMDYLIGRLPKSLSAFGTCHTDSASGIEDVAYLNLDFGDGLLASFHVNWLSPVKIRHFLVGGSRKGLVYNDLAPDEKIKVYDRGITVSQDAEARRGLLIGYRTGDVWSPRIEGQEPLQVMVRHFAESVRDGKQPLTGGEAGLRVVRILEAAQHSIKAQGGRITL
jgi:predicted dehydrogenase